MSAPDDLPDPVAYARGLSTDELLEYRSIYGAESREWVIAKRELDRRSPKEHSLHGLLARIAFVSAAIAAYLYFRWR